MNSEALSLPTAVCESDTRRSEPFNTNMPRPMVLLRRQNNIAGCCLLFLVFIVVFFSLLREQFTLLAGDLSVSWSRRRPGDRRRDVCTVDIVRRYGVERGYFPTAGHWNSTRAESPDCAFTPRLCRFSSVQFPYGEHNQLFFLCLTHDFCFKK